MSTLAANFIFLSTIVLVVQLHRSSPAVYPPNIEYAIYGYDIIRANPWGDDQDPGFLRGVIFKIQYTKVTAGSPYYLSPDNIDILRTPTCSEGTTVKSFSSAKEYQSLLAIDASITASIFPFAFSGSVDYQTVKRATQYSSLTYVTANKKCSLYTATLSVPHTPLDSRFIQAINSLPFRGADKTPFFAFLDQYGTHYIDKIQMGAKRVYSRTIDQTTMSQLIQCGLKVEALARVILPGSVGVTSSAQTKLLTSFNDKSSRTVVSSQGSLVDGSSVFGSQSTATDNPYPISFTLNPIAGLVRREYFPAISSADLSYKQQMITNATQEFCSYRAPNCETVSPVVPSKTSTEPSPQTCEDIDNSDTNNGLGVAAIVGISIAAVIVFMGIILGVVACGCR